MGRRAHESGNYDPFSEYGHMQAFVGDLVAQREEDIAAVAYHPDSLGLAQIMHSRGESALNPERYSELREGLGGEYGLSGKEVANALHRSVRYTKDNPAQWSID